MHTRIINTSSEENRMKIFRKSVKSCKNSSVKKFIIKKKKYKNKNTLIYKVVNLHHTSISYVSTYRSINKATPIFLYSFRSLPNWFPPNVWIKPEIKHRSILISPSLYNKNIYSIKARPQRLFIDNTCTHHARRRGENSRDARFRDDDGCRTFVSAPGDV